MRPLQHQRILGRILIVMASAPYCGESAALIESPGRDVGGTDLEIDRHHPVGVGGGEGIVEQHPPEAAATGLWRRADVGDFALVSGTQKDAVSLDFSVRVLDHA